MIRPLEDRDGPAMLAFMNALPPQETTFFKDEQIATTRVSDWATHRDALRLVATGSDGETISGYVAVIAGRGLSAHVGEISLVVAEHARGRGVGQSLARAAVVGGFGRLGLRKLVVEVVADQDGTARMFKRIGFNAEALLRDHLCDRAGRMRDLLLLCHLAHESWSDMATLGIPDEIHAQ